jgi:hypothetical protein
LRFSVKQSCVMMGQELGMPPAELEGDAKPVCDHVIATYQNNLKVTLKAGAKLTVKFTPAVCTALASAQTRIQANFEVSVSVSASASATAGG